MQGQIDHRKFGNSQNSNSEMLFVSFQISIQSEVKEIILVNSGLIEVRFNPCKMRFTSHLT